MQNSYVLWRERMHELLVVGFKDRYQADALLTEMKELEKAAIVELEDSVLLDKTPDGETITEQSFDLFSQIPTTGALYFGFLGGLVGWIFSGASFMGALFGVQAGLVIGWLAGTVAAKYSAAGVPKKVINEVTGAMNPGTSSLILAVRGDLNTEKVLNVLRANNGCLVQTTLPRDEALALQKAMTC